VPALHHAVLDDDLHPALAGPVDERAEHLLGVAEVVRDAPGRVAPDEGADARHPEQGGGVDERQDVGVDGFAFGRVGVQVVVVEGQRRQGQAVPIEQRGHLVGLPLAEAVDVEVGRGERSVAESRPGGHLQRLERVRRCPGGDVGEAALR
jgi:hypothetical protein